MYDAPGTYTVNLTVSNDNGIQGGAEKQISVQQSSSRQSSSGNPAVESDATTQSPTPRPTPTSGADTSDAGDGTVLAGTQTSSGTTTAEPLTTSTPNGTVDTQRERGFIMNDADSDPLNFLSSPLRLTMAGFVVSALGILIQLFGGR